MAVPSTHEITALLHAWRQGDQYTMKQLAPIVEGELDRRAVKHVKADWSIPRHRR